MNLQKYSVGSDNNHLTYEFFSEGPKGTIKKVVLYQEIDENVFNLAFGDWNEVKQKIDDSVRSNNDDRDKVLATVGSSVIDFIRHHPQAIIFAKGITPGKTRLYQMGINTNWNEVAELFDVEGLNKGNWEPFEANKNYQAFTLKLK